VEGGGFCVPFSAYDADALRVLTRALFEALATLNKSVPRPLTSSEKAHFHERIIRNLKEAYDAGQRDPEALKRIALRGVLISPLPR
jgi:hypothetical protein